MIKHIYVRKILVEGEWLDNQVLTCDGAIISTIAPLSSIPDVRFDERIDGWVIPGYIDTQVNGGGGVMFNHAPTFASLNVIADAHLHFGTTTLFPTLISDETDTITQAADAIAEAVEQQHPAIMGVHFEGPHLSTDKKGIHLSRYIRAISDIELATYTRRDIGQVIVTVAPENVPCDVIRELVDKNVVVALGHSNAPYEVAARAIEAGATGFTHLFNAMSALTSREPGMVGAALSHNSLCGLIVDHQHVHPKTVALAYGIKGPHQLMLVTDAMAHVGANVSDVAFFDTHITRRGDKLTTSEGTLAGSCLDMHGAVTNCVKDIKVPLAQASIMASTTPAMFTKIQGRVGRLAVGMYANFLELDDAGALRQIWQHGVKRNNK